MTTHIRRLKQDEVSLLDTFLYQAIFIPEGVEPLSLNIIQEPDLQAYIGHFGERSGDVCYVAEVAGQIVGAAWVRLINSYGYINAGTPILSISLLPAYRRQGLGTQLMSRLLATLKKQGYKQVSLSVQKANPAYHLYRKLGFQVFAQQGDEYIMICLL